MNGSSQYFADEFNGPHTAMTEDQLSFVYLRYSPDAHPGERVGLPLVVVFAKTGLQIVISPTWREQLEREDREYLNLLISDWQETSSDMLPSLQEALSELSVGPLQAVESGPIDHDRLNEIIRRISSGEASM